MRSEPPPFFLFFLSASPESFLYSPKHQVIPKKKGRDRRSNEGYRKLDLPERVLIFLSRQWRKVHFSALGYLYGCGKSTAHEYYEELRNIFYEKLVPRLVFPPSPRELRAMLPQKVLEAFPDLLTILDATNWGQETPENFLLNRLAYSAYKHEVVFQVLLGIPALPYTICTPHFPSKQSLRPTDWCSGGLKSTGAFPMRFPFFWTNLRCPARWRVTFVHPRVFSLPLNFSIPSCRVSGSAGQGPICQGCSGRRGLQQVEAQDDAWDRHSCPPLQRWHPGHGRFFSVLAIDTHRTHPQSPVLKDNHSVQSHRVVVEQTIGDLKRAKILFGNKVAKIKERAKDLDCVLALHNLRVRRKTDPKYSIPPRRRPLPEEHVFGPLVPFEELDLKIPPRVTSQMEAKVSHVRAFQQFLTSQVAALREALAVGEEECVFYPAVGSRGGNLFNGAYVLQLRVSRLTHGRWAVKYIVGASYSYETHEGHFEMVDGIPVDCHICDCYAG